MNINDILHRTSHEKCMTDFLLNFNKMDDRTQKCVYICGTPGIGKTTFAKQILKKLGYHIISYDTNDNRNKNIIDSINENNMSDKSVIDIFTKKKSNIVILMDEVDHMNIGDKGGINSLIKLIRPKKTKRQKSEAMTHVPIVCIGNITQEKKIKELMKYCVTIELPPIQPEHIHSLMKLVVPKYEHLYKKVTNLNKLFQLVDLSHKNFNGDIQSVFYTNVHVSVKQLTQRIMNQTTTFMDHECINETDRTIIALLFHENVIDVFKKHSIKDCIDMYISLLNEMCFADYIDRITFQKQLWDFNEMSSIIKTFYTNHLLHETYKPKLTDIRFTKVLTKYSTEYNNYSFIQKLCNELGMDKKDAFTYLLSMQKKYTDAQLLDILKNTNITALDLNRFVRYINNSVDKIEE